jgi:hypothetical protein
MPDSFLMIDESAAQHLYKITRAGPPTQSMFILSNFLITVNISNRKTARNFFGRAQENPLVLQKAE